VGGRKGGKVQLGSTLCCGHCQKRGKKRTRGLDGWATEEARKERKYFDEKGGGELVFALEI